MNIEPGLFATLISILGAALLAGVAWILRTLTAQNTAMAGQSQALAVLIARVDPTVQKTASLETTVLDLSQRVLRLEISSGITAAAGAQSPVTVNV